MDDIKVLKDIGLRKVSNETHIEEKYLKYMVDGDFDKLDYVNTLGFIKILSREYGLDLSGFRETFEEYWNENRKSEQSDGLFIVVEDSSRGSKKFLFFLLIILLIVTVGMLFSIFKDKVDFASNNTSINKDTLIEQSVVVEEAKESLENAIKNNEENLSIQDTNEVSDLNETDNIAIDTNETNVNEELHVESTDVNTTALSEDTNASEKEKEVSKNIQYDAVIAPNAKLWVGTINLDDKKRRSFLGEGNFSIDLSHDQIITTGHGNFSLHVKDKTIDYKSQAPIRFLVKDGNITKITWEKFVELNEGKPW
ncbi:hypothetical protein ACKGJI_01160 [Sulfurospirillum sp. 1307]